MEKFEEMHDEEMYCFVAPDGSAQLATMAPEFGLCIAFSEVLHVAGLGLSPSAMFEAGFEILPVKLTLVQNGTAQEGYTRAREKLLIDGDED